MKIRHCCFLSYAHGKYALMNSFKDELADAVRCYLEPHVDHEDELFIDSEQLGAGDDLDGRIGQALCTSACMIAIYTPRYESHPYTRREFAAMQQIEAARRQWIDLPSHLVIPVIMTRHTLDLPPQIKGPGMYVDFSRYTMATGSLKAHPDFLPGIEKLVARIAALYEIQKMCVQDAGNCNQFELPAVPPPWRATPDRSFPKI